MQVLQDAAQPQRSKLLCTDRPATRRCRCCSCDDVASPAKQSQSPTTSSRRCVRVTPAAAGSVTGPPAVGPPPPPRCTGQLGAPAPLSCSDTDPAATLMLPAHAPDSPHLGRRCTQVSLCGHGIGCRACGLVLASCGWGPSRRVRQ